jgi:hypothetical protein
MNSQNKPQTTTKAIGNFYKTLLALLNTYPPEDDLGIPKLNEGTSRDAQWLRDNSFADLSPQRKNTN